METKPSEAKNERHALVIGGSLAGLLAARVLCDHFDQVTIVERDIFTNSSEARRGTPQANLHIKRRLLADSRFRIFERTHVTGLIPADKNAVGGAIVPVQTGDGESIETNLFADFVVDATGRSSRAPQWLEQIGYPSTQNRLRQPRNFVALSDSGFNPVYGQGITIAAMEAITLDECLRNWGTDDRNFARRFQRRLSKVTAAPWMLATIMRVMRGRLKRTAQSQPQVHTSSARRMVYETAD